MAPAVVSEFWLDLVAGWVGGAASVLAVQPVDTTLTRMQAVRLGPGVDAGARAVFSKVIREGGTRALWRGTAPMTMVIPFQNALLFAGYGLGERWAKQTEDNSALGGEADDCGTSAANVNVNANANALVSLYAPIFAGGCVGGVAQSFAVSPFELVKIRQQNAGSRAPARKLTALLGGGILFRGLGATILRDGVPHGVWFVAYESSKRALERVSETKVEATRADASPEKNARASGSPSQTATAIPLAAGAFAAAAAWGVGYPFDTIKTRVQASTAAAGGSAAPGLIATAREMMAEHRGSATRGLYRGFGVKMLRAVPASAIAFFSYEETRRWLG